MEAPKPQAEHQWLMKLAGEWTFTEPRSKTPMAGTERVRRIGDLWVQCEGVTESGGMGPATAVMTLGYDTQKGRFVGTWFGTMMTYLWIYEGQLDPTRAILTLESTGPSMSGDGSMARYQDIITFEDDDHRTLTARVQKADGSWEEFMQMRYERRR